MKKLLLSFLFIGITTGIFAQRQVEDFYKSSNLTFGGYGEIVYNQLESLNGKLDVQRLIVLMGYKFSDKVGLLTEIEYEHVNEVYVEQFYLNYKLTDNFNIRGGLMLVPMGIVNEYHEPTFFNGVNRPSVDGNIVPTTWREIGIGVSGKSDEISLSYQAYIFNGFKSYDGTKGYIGGSGGLRGGRQRGISSTINKPNLSAKVNFYAIQGLKVGLAGYFGRTQATDNVDMIDGADVGVSMIGLDARYNNNRFNARGQYIYTDITDAAAYNTLTNMSLGSAMEGWYLETSYNLLPTEKEQELHAFTRYEIYDTHAKVEGNLAKNKSFDRTDITFGLSYHVAKGAVVKVDYQIKDDATVNNVKNQFNAGIGVVF
jgi:hypothetical protein